MTQLKAIFFVGDLSPESRPSLSALCSSTFINLRFAPTVMEVWGPRRGGSGNKIKSLVCMKSRDKHSIFSLYLQYFFLDNTRHYYYYLSVCLSVRMFVCLVCLSICLIYLSFYLSIYLIYLSVCLSNPICLSINLIYLSVCLPC